MNVSKLKRNSMIISKKYQLNDHLNKVEKKITKNNLNKIQLPQNIKIENKPNNNLSLKSEFNIQKRNSNDQNNPLTYIKSVPSHIVKKQYYITPKIENNKKESEAPSQDLKSGKNEDSLSTFPLTKESMIMTPKKNIDENSDEQKNNMRALSCAQRNRNKNKENMIFVKKKIQGGLKNSFILNKSDIDFQVNNSCCYYGEYPQQNINFNPNNSVDYGSCNYYNKKYMNILNNNLERNPVGNRVLITNNNINLITNNNFISNNDDNDDKEEDKYILRNHNSVTLRNNHNPKMSQIRVVKNLNNKNNINVIKYLDNMESNCPTNYNIISKDARFYPQTKNKDITLKMKNNNYNVIMNENNNIKVSADYNKLNQTIKNQLFREINFEDFYMLLKKFEMIKNNLILLGNLKHSSNKQLLENINMSRIIVYDLYKFYLGSSIEGCPQNFYTEKNSKIYLHFYSVVLILSLGLLYVIFHKIKMTKDYQEKLLILINLQQKAFLIFCDSMINKINYKKDDIDTQDIWVNKIILELKEQQLFYTTNHVMQLKILSIDSYKIFNDMILNIYFSNNHKLLSKKNDQEIFLYKHFYNKTINYLAQIKIHELEEIFDKNIFKIITLRSNFANITSLKGNNIMSNASPHSKPKTNFIFNNEDLGNNNNYKFSIKPLLFLNKTKAKNHQKNNSGINSKQLIQNIKIKEPYLDFPPTKPYTLVLDLDETMISFQFTQPKNGIGQMHLRPGLENFLGVIKEYYEIIVFTSGTREYADMVLDVIEHKKQKKYFTGRLYREHTTKIGKKYIKDLSKLGRELSRTLIVDNLPQSFKFQHENGILISSFYADENDKEDDRALTELQKILIKIYEDKRDVRLSIMKYKEEIIRNVSCLDLRKNYNDNDDDD